MVFIYCQHTYAQEDNRLWLSASLEHDVIKKLDFSYGFSWRNENDFTQFSSTNSDFSASYKLSKHLKTEVAYRFSYFKSSYSNRLTYGIKWDDGIYKRTDLQVKTKIQYEYLLDGYTPEKTWRTKATISHKIKKRKIYTSFFFEGFLGLNFSELSSEKARIGANIDLNGLKKQVISFGYFRQIKYLGSQSNVLCIEYKIKL